ncbi:MAG: ribonuclease Y [Deltaproteobacteria bacterium]|nr:ribonuclease Y [Deltaproteobacteria bacterium]
MNLGSIVSGAAVGAVASWVVAARRAREAAEALRAEHERAARARAEAEALQAEGRARLAALQAQLDQCLQELEGTRAQRETARAEAEAFRRTAELSQREATLRAREELRAEVEAATRGRAEELVQDGRRRAQAAEAEARARGEKLLADARVSAQEALSEARARQQELGAREEHLARRETAAVQKDDVVLQREQDLSRREQSLGDRERAVSQREAEAERLLEERRRAAEEDRKRGQEAVERAAGLTAEDARRELVEGLRDEARRAVAREAKAIEEAAREEAEKRAKRVVGIAIQRYAGEYAGERAVTSVTLPNDELKGRIIGREGRNIRTFQEVTGCDLVIDDTPETIVVSSFDPVRREMARLTLERLIQDGRIHPTKIEELFNRSRDDVERSIREAADQAVLELGIPRLHPELMKIVGQLKYRYSYAQNVLRHSIEVGHLCGLLAAELGLNAKQAKRAGLLHDIGKAVTHEMEGGHAVIGAQFARKAGEDDVVTNAIAAHHDDEPPRSLLAHLTAAADAISGARPGARREMLEGYVRRLEDLERICSSFKGVEKSFAIQAGREVRVLVEPGEVDDVGALALSREIARKIEEELAYPGQIRVTVVRETRSVDYAR